MLGIGNENAHRNRDCKWKLDLELDQMQREIRSYYWIRFVLHLDLLIAERDLIHIHLEITFRFTIGYYFRLDYFP